MKPANDIYVNSQRKILPRSTYTPVNAFRWKPVFDEAISSGRDVLIPFKPKDSPNYLSPLTLKQQVTDALLWLTDNTPEEPISEKDKFTRKDYCILRGSAKIRLTKDGILIDFNEAAGFIPVVKSSAAPLGKESTWKSQLTTFLASDESILFIKDLNLSSQDIDWIHELLKDIKEVEYEVNNYQLKVAK